MAGKKPEVVEETKEQATAPAEQPRSEVPGWPGVMAETPEEHDARRRAEAEANA